MPAAMDFHRSVYDLAEDIEVDVGQALDGQPLPVL
jgi:hypothetical protein